MTVQLTLVERAMLVNQYRILQLLQPGSGTRYEKIIEALEKGFTRDYGEALDVWDSEVPLHVCNEVIDIMAMYRGIFFAMRDLAEPVEDPWGHLNFDGFDGNEEGDDYSYANYLLHTLDLFSELKAGGANSHAYRLPRYRSMLALWRQRGLGGERGPSKADLEALANA